jgi:hypothetical protein
MRDFRYTNQFINPLHQLKKTLREQYQCSGKRLVALQKRYRKLFKAELGDAPRHLNAK